MEYYKQLIKKYCKLEDIMRILGGNSIIMMPMYFIKMLLNITKIIITKNTMDYTFT